MSEVPLQPQAGRVHGGAALAGHALSSDTMHLSIGLGKAASPQVNLLFQLKIVDNRLIILLGS